MTSLVLAIAMWERAAKFSTKPSARILKGLANTRKGTSLLLLVDFGNIGLLGRTRKVSDANAQDTANFVIAKKINDVTRISLRLHDFCLPQHGKLLRDCILLEIEDLA